MINAGTKEVYSLTEEQTLKSSMHDDTRRQVKLYTVQ